MLSPFVPNVPCGVESNQLSYPTFRDVRFLMYRVELKAPLGEGGRLGVIPFLMYRVELKAEWRQRASSAL